MVKLRLTMAPAGVVCMAEHINVNGARIEREFFEANVAEARSCGWERTECMGMTDDHEHCIVCTVAIGNEVAYRSGCRWLCAYCYSHFVGENA
ncbi:MAG: hypothetical protein JXL80_17675 [Planctomycetes bacterium]|nr:hypothetical protein [Planctomycetota bacterium]